MNETALEVRLSHVLRDCSVGAIVQGEKLMVAVQDISRWYTGEPPPDQEIRYVAQVRAALGIEQGVRLCEPPTGSVTEQGVKGTSIPATRFPGWMRCPRRNCGLLHNKPWRGREVDTPLHCRDCGRELEQVPWVVAHSAGYLADVPWHLLAHRSGEGSPGSKSCEADWSEPYLRLVEGKGHRSVRCTRCRAEGAMPRQLRFPQGEWMQPWVGPPPPTDPEELAWLLEVNDVRVHASWTSSALVIPPESRIRKGTVVDRLYGNSRFLADLHKPDSRGRALRKIARELRCDEKDVEGAWRQIRSGYPAIDTIDRTVDLDRLEYGALIKAIEDFNEDEDFVTQHRTSDWKQLSRSLKGEARLVVDAVDRLIEVRRLKEITILRGFRRLGSDVAIPPDLTGDASWLPALALRGEGLFFTLDEAMLKAWEDQSNLWLRAEGLRRRYEEYRPHGSAMEIGISPRFLMLHTLAHCLIRQLEAEGGYPAASIRERIYCGSDPSPMAGILVYVAVPDVIGSLGGLVELAEPMRFLRHMIRAFEAATWCSLDPICAGHAGQGPGLLNGAACAACALVPEPSCQHGNVLLDRTFVKGDSEQSISRLLDSVQSRE